jgi:OOP family OmpA-OmpF porin
MTSTLYRSLFLLIAAAAAPLAHAQGSYVGASIGSANSGTLNFNDGKTVNKIDSNKGQHPLSVFAGVDLTPALGGEVGVTGLGGKTNFDLDGQHNVQSSVSALYVAAKGTLHLNEDWSVVGKLGVGQSRFHMTTNVPDGGDLSAHRNSVYSSVGLSYKVNDSIALQLELSHLEPVKAQGFKVGMNNLSLGARYGF